MTQLYRYVLGTLLIIAPSIIQAVPANTIIATTPF